MDQKTSLLEVVVDCRQRPATQHTLAIIIVVFVFTLITPACLASIYSRIGFTSVWFTRHTRCYRHRLIHTGVHRNPIHRYK